MFGDLAKALQGQGPLNWDAARQFAQLGATGGSPEANVDPAVRLAFADLARIAWFHVADVVGSGRRRPSRRSSRAASGPTARSTPIATCSPRWPPPSARPVADDDPDAAGDPMMAMMAGLSKMMAPAMLGMAVGSMVGHLATRAFGTHDLPIPRQPATRHAGAVEHRRVRRGLGDPDRRDAAVGARPRAGRSRPVRGRPTSVTRCRTSCASTSAGSVPIPTPSPSGSARSTATPPTRWPRCSRRSAIPRCSSAPSRRPPSRRCGRDSTPLVAVVVGYTDWIVDAVAVARRRRQRAAHRRGRAPAAGGDHVQRLVRRATARHPPRRGPGRPGQGVRAGRRRPGRRRRAGPAARRPDAIPTPNEVDAPGLWLARIERLTERVRSRRGIAIARRAIGRRTRAGAWRRQRAGGRRGADRRAPRRPAERRSPGAGDVVDEATRRRGRRSGSRPGRGSRSITGIRPATAQANWKRVSNRAKARPRLACGASRWTMLSNASRPTAAAKLTATASTDAGGRRPRAARRGRRRRPTSAERAGEHRLLATGRRSVGETALPAIVPSADSPTAAPNHAVPADWVAQPERQEEEHEPDAGPQHHHRHRGQLQAGRVQLHPLGRLLGRAATTSAGSRVALARARRRAARSRSASPSP